MQYGGCETGVELFTPVPVGARCESKEMRAVSEEEVPESRAGSDYTKLIKKEGMSGKGVCTPCVTIKPHLQGAQQSPPNCVQDFEIKTDVWPEIVFHIIIKIWFYFLQSLIQYVNM